MPLLEILMHFHIDIRDLPARYWLLKIQVRDNVEVERVAMGHLPRDWQQRVE